MRILPKDNLAYPVLITLDTGVMGTGVYINDNSFIYLATAKHVLFNEVNNIRGSQTTLKSYTQDLDENDYTQIDLDLMILSQQNNILFHSTGDVSLIKLFSVSPDRKTTSLPGVVVVNMSSKGVIGVNISTTSKVYSEVLISNDIFIFGYPVSIGLRNLPQINYSMPLLRKGIIAGKNDSNKTIILDCPVYQGNSGGPIIQIEPMRNGFAFTLVGLISEFVPVEDRWENKSYGLTNVQWSNSGYSVATPVDFIKELLTQFQI